MTTDTDLILARMTAVVIALTASGLVFPYGFPLITPAIAALLGATALAVLAGDRRLHYDPELLVLWTLLLAFVLWGGAMSNTLYTNVRGDVVNAIAVLMLFPVVARLAAHGVLSRMRDAFAVIVYGLMVPIACVCLYKFALMLRGEQLALVSAGRDGNYPVGSALQDDYNMAALGLTVGAAAGVWLAARTDSVLLRWLIGTGIALIVVAALLTGSRRFYVVFGVVLLVAMAVGGRALWRVSVRLLTTSRIARTSAAHLTGIAALVLFAIAVLGPRIAELDLLGSVTHVQRLFVRLGTLLTLGESFGGSRGMLLAESFRMVEAFGWREYAAGAGFDYLRVLADGLGERYPHNQLVAGLLYGGLANLLLVTLLLGRAAWLYASRWRTEMLLCSVFFVTFAFTFISGNTVFSNRFFLMLIIVGFMLRHQRRRDES